MRTSVPTIVLALMLASPATADINGFSANRISGDGLSDRFTTTDENTTRKISLADCEAYLGVDASSTCSGSSSSTDTTDTTDTGTDTTDTTDTGTDTTDTGTDTTDDGTDTTDDGTDTTDDGTDTTDDGTDTTDDTTDDGTGDGDAGTDDGTGTGGSAPGKYGTQTGAAAVESFTIDVAFAESADEQNVAYTALGVAVGSNCDSNSFPSENTDTCTVVRAEADYDDWGQEESYTIKMADLLGDDCSSSSDVYIYFYAKKDGETASYDVEQFEFDVDFTPPNAPKITSVDVGESNLTVNWEASDSDETGLTYTVYYSTSAFTSDDLGRSDVLVNDEGLTGTSNQISGLANGTPVYVAVSAVDEAGNPSTFCDNESDQNVGTPILVDDFWELYLKDHGQERGGNFQCALGSTPAPLMGVVLLGLLALWLRRREVTR